MSKNISNILRVPFGSLNERVNTRQYVWSSRLRGSNEFVIIQRTESGCGIFEMDGKISQVQAGEAFIAIIPEHSSYRWDSPSGEPWVFSWINIYGRFAKNLFHDFRKRWGEAIAMEEEGGAARRFYHLAQVGARRIVTDPYVSSAETYAFLMEWTRELETQAILERDPVEETMHACETRFREPLSVKGLADEVGLSREHLTRIFMERRGVGPAEYLRKIRVQEAETLLRAGSLPMRELALRAGFPSVQAMQRARLSMESKDD